MSHGFSLLALLFPFVLIEASCIPDYKTQTKEGVVYAKDDNTTPYSGCIVQAYPDGQKKSELFYHNGRPTGEGRRWFANGPKQSEITHKAGKIYTKKLWNYEGYLYAFERYKDGKRIHPVEMAYAQAVTACQDATFHGHGGWKLPSVQELYKVPFSEETKDRTYIASNPPQYVQSVENVSYVRFGSSENDSRWDNDDLNIKSRLSVICIAEGNPEEFHLIMGLNKIPDLTSEYVDDNVRMKALSHSNTARQAPPVPSRYDTRQHYIPDAEDVMLMSAEEIERLKEASARKAAAPEETAYGQAAVEKKEANKEPVLPKQEDFKQKALRSGFYISIYTYEDELPDAEKLDAILQAGYRYKLGEFARQGKKTKNVLIGPFRTEQKAQKELTRVHKKIVDDAYIIDNTY